MKTTRRTFVSTTVLGSGAAAMAPWSAWGATDRPNANAAVYAALDEAYHRPVLRRELFPAPVIIETIELLQDRKNFRAGELRQS